MEQVLAANSNMTEDAKHCYKLIKEKKEIWVNAHEGHVYLLNERADRWPSVPITYTELPAL